MKLFNNLNINVLQKSLDGAWAKQGAISNNIANADTPGYKRQNVDFESQIMSQIKSAKTQKSSVVSNKINNMKFRTQVNKNTSNRLDGNNVDLDVENIELAKVQLQYEYLLREVNDELNRIRYVIKN